MTDRGTCWSITINNPLPGDLNVVFPNNKWKMQGQMEMGVEGTMHYQGMLETPQVRFSAVKRLLPRAHIELAKNRRALEKYVTKTETRVAEVAAITSNIPTLFDYQHTIAEKWDDIAFEQFVIGFSDEYIAKHSIDEVALQYVDKLVSEDIKNGVCGIEYIAINPMWRSAWKRFWKAMIHRERMAKINSYGIDIDDAPCSTSPPCEDQSNEENQEMGETPPTTHHSECE